MGEEPNIFFCRISRPDDAYFSLKHVSVQLSFMKYAMFSRGVDQSITENGIELWSFHSDLQNNPLIYQIAVWFDGDEGH